MCPNLLIYNVQNLLYHGWVEAREGKELLFSLPCPGLECSGSLQLTTLSFLLLPCQPFCQESYPRVFGEAECDGCPCSYSAPSLWGRHLGTAVAGVATKGAANWRQTELSSSLSAPNYPEGIGRMCTGLFNYVILSTVNKYSYLVNKPFIL